MTAVVDATAGEYRTFDPKPSPVMRVSRKAEDPSLLGADWRVGWVRSGVTDLIERCRGDLPHGRLKLKSISLDALLRDALVAVGFSVSSVEVATVDTKFRIDHDPMVAAVADLGGVQAHGGGVHDRQSELLGGSCFVTTLRLPAANPERPDVRAWSPAIGLMR